LIPFSVLLKGTVNHLKAILAAVEKAAGSIFTKAQQLTVQKLKTLSI
jgi:hypothetical protein